MHNQGIIYALIMSYILLGYGFNNDQVIRNMSDEFAQIFKSIEKKSPTAKL